MAGREGRAESDGDSDCDPGSAVLRSSQTRKIWRSPGGERMDALQPIVIQAIAGIIGGGIAGNLIRVAATAMLPKVIAGALGGIAMGTLFASLLGRVVPAMDPAATGDAAAAASSVDAAALLAQIGGGLIGGALLTGLVGAALLRR